MCWGFPDLGRGPGRRSATAGGRAIARAVSPTDPPSSSDHEENSELDSAVPKEVTAQVAAAADLLESLIADRALLAGLEPQLVRRLLIAAGQVSRPERSEQRRLSRERRRQNKTSKREKYREVVATAGIRASRRQSRLMLSDQMPPLAFGSDDAELPDSIPSESRPLPQSRNCYICKVDYDSLHHFYDALCPECAEFNWAKRSYQADLSGRVAILTGARVKIGYETGLKLLRAGATLVATTRFPRDAALRYAAEADFADWGGSLEIYGLDLRHTPSVEAFCRHMADRHERLDFILNNACQTVRRPPGFYSHLIEDEALSLESLPAGCAPLLQNFDRLRQSHRDETQNILGSTSELALGREHQGLVGLAHAPELSQLPLIEGDLDAGAQLFPKGQLDDDLQQVDLRGINSWRLPLDEVSAVELLEVHLVNAVAPFVLNARLKSLMSRTDARDKHIVNVSAMEGQFYRSFKTDKHPHTNMAKAALNMMTRTSAVDYIKAGIHMNSVDTGWITDEDPAQIAEEKRRSQDFHPPLDSIDAAARICDPIFSGIETGEHVWGQFLKDYRPTRW